MRKLGRTKYDAAVMAVAHNQFKELGVRGVRKLLKPKSVIYDIKHVFKRGQTDGRL
jgi:UDP-N-acetyl-D-galactosamine dehydrogenase